MDGKRLHLTVDPELAQRDDDLLRLARGVAAVDRAGARRRATLEGRTPPALFRIPAGVDVPGWPSCDRVGCGRPVEPGGAVRFRGAVYHAECVAGELHAAAA